MAKKKVRGLSVEFEADLNKFNKEVESATGELKKTGKELKAIQKNLDEGISPEGLVRGLEIAEKASQAAADKMAALNRQRQFFLENNIKDANGIGIFDKELRENSLQMIETETVYKKANNAADNFREAISELNLETKKYTEEIGIAENETEELGIKAENVSEKFDKLGDKFEAAGKKLRGVSTAAAGIVAGLGAIGVKAASEGAAIDDLAQRLGVSAEKAQEWQYVAVQLGVDAEVFSKAMVKARAAMLDLDSGKTNEQAKAMETLGLSMSEFGSQEEMFDGVMGALSGLGDKTKQAALANEIFGDKIANQLLPYLNAGQDAVNGLKEEWASLGGMSNKQVAELAVLDDMIYRLKTAFKNLTMQIGTAVMPVLEKGIAFIEEKVLPKFRAVMEFVGNLSDKTATMIPIILAVVAAAAPVLTMLGKLSKGVGSLVSQLPKLTTALSVISSHPIVLVIGVVIGLLAMLYTRNEAFRESVNGLFTALSSALAPLMEIGGKILSPLIVLLGSLTQTILPLIEIALKPLESILSLLSIPLNAFSLLLVAVMPLFDLFGKIVTGLFSGIAIVINGFLGFIENAINWIIDKVNGVIDLINLLGDATGWYHIDAVQRVEIGKMELPDANVSASGSGSVEDIYRSGTLELPAGSTVVNNSTTNDNSTKNITVNVTVEAVGGDVDMDDLVRKINLELGAQL